MKRMGERGEERKKLRGRGREIRERLYKETINNNEH